MSERRTAPRPGRSSGRSKLAAVRLRRRLTQQELAEHAGVSRAAIQRIEAGDTDNPPLRLLTNLAVVLRCQLAEVIEPEWLTWKTTSPGHGPPDRKELEQLERSRQPRNRSGWMTG